MTQYAAAIRHSGNVWLTFATRDAALDFIKTAPVDMCVVSRMASGDTHGPWVMA